MKKIFVIVFIMLTFVTKAQDSTAKAKPVHEIGFNSVLLIKQVVNANANSATSTLPMLPYQLIYTVHFANNYGFRLGAGIEQNKTKTSVSGQITPRETATLMFAGRIGVNKNVFRHNKFTCNLFADAVFENTSSHTVTTFTSTSGPFGGTVESTIETNDVATGYGGQVGIGLKYNFNKHISLYIETPVQLKYVTNNSNETDTNAGSGITYSTADGSTLTTKIYLPTTLFLNISF